MRYQPKSCLHKVDYLMGPATQSGSKTQSCGDHMAGFGAKAVLFASFYFFLVFVVVLWLRRTYFLNRLASATADEWVRLVVDIGDTVADIPVEDDATAPVIFAREANTLVPSSPAFAQLDRVQLRQYIDWLDMETAALTGRYTPDHTTTRRDWPRWPRYGDGPIMLPPLDVPLSDLDSESDS